MIVADRLRLGLGVLELLMLGGLTLTIRCRTTLAAVGVGLYACAPVSGEFIGRWSDHAADQRRHAALGV